MWKRFSEKARKVVYYAQREALRLGAIHVSTEHLLLALIRDDNTAAVNLLDQAKVNRNAIREELELVVRRGDGNSAGEVRLSPFGKRAIDLAYDEMNRLGDNYIGTEHLLLALLRSSEGVTVPVLAKHAPNPDEMRIHVAEFQKLRMQQIKKAAKKGA